MESTSIKAVTTDLDSQLFIGQWRRLVSTTNWEKGRIIFEWRQAATKRRAPIAEYSDEAWSRLVGGVSPQHVGRLRRVFERFGSDHPTYEGLFWSHFQAALEWEDAEMWLEGAVQDRWSVAQMRRHRWETLGGDEPHELDVVESELDEDLEVVNSAPPGSVEHGRRPSTADAPSAPPAAERISTKEVELQQPRDEQPEPAKVDPFRPFADLPSLPEDLADAIETLKVVILKYKLAKWTQIARDDVLGHLHGLQQMVMS